jgi:hypothetical protein
MAAAPSLAQEVPVDAREALMNGSKMPGVMRLDRFPI